MTENKKMKIMYDVITIAPWARKAGITFVLESLSEIAHKGYLLKDTKTCDNLVRAIDSPNVKILYDAYHAYLEEGKLCETISQYIDDIGLVKIYVSRGIQKALGQNKLNPRWHHQGRFRNALRGLK